MQADSDCEVSMQADSDVKFKSLKLNNDANWGPGKQSKNCVFLS